MHCGILCGCYEVGYRNIEVEDMRICALHAPLHTHNAHAYALYALHNCTCTTSIVSIHLNIKCVYLLSNYFGDGDSSINGWCLSPCHDFQPFHIVLFDFRRFSLLGDSLTRLERAMVDFDQMVLVFLSSFFIFFLNNAFKVKLFKTKHCNPAEVKLK